MIRLSNRLQLLFDLLLPGEPVWDLCCDHGLLGLRALEAGFPSVAFVDQVPHLISRLEGILERQPVELRARASCYAMPAEEIPVALQGSVVIAGVGATRIIGILSALQSADRLSGTSRLVMCPHKDEKDFVRDFEAAGLPFRLVSHHEVVEAGRLRQVWVAEIGS